MTALAALTREIEGCRICADRFAVTATGHAPRPVPWLSNAPILVCGQAPGARVHASGIPFDDRSGDRLRDWLGVDRKAFYDRQKFAVLPMAFCFPGYDAKGTDLPPPKVCAQNWHDRVMAALPRVRLMLLIGGYAQEWHLGAKGVTATVARWRDHAPDKVPLPHPSWRNTAWLKKNPAFEAELVPWLRDRVAEILNDG
ncbi:uracil-DNA glycosylase family protein [Algicella marina]|uniref:Uracil-DNA glycosylase family protein n=2 Tax=Algicella marina TaxID=2683284 RepID=A0A6P1T5M8_9RHOB|nr:uracil-DNA glycosylase family protein [Algicella marina]